MNSNGETETSQKTTNGWSLALPFSWSRRQGYQVSSIGDKRFSALYAVIENPRFFGRDQKRRGFPRARTIEEIYQCDIKGYDPGGIDWMRGKGKPSRNTGFDLYTAYLGLWYVWAKENPALMFELRLKAIMHNGLLADVFASTPINQARALSDLLNQGFGQ